MASCKQVCDLLSQLSAHAVPSPPADPDLDRLGQLGLVGVYTADQYRGLVDQVGTLEASQNALAAEQAQDAGLRAELAEDAVRDHSILFHLHGRDRKAADLAAEADERSRSQALDADLTQKEQAFNALLVQKSVLDNLTTVGSRYAGLTPAGAVALRDLTVRLYRYGDTDFESYLAQAQRIDQDLVGVAAGGASYLAGLASGIPDADRAYLWAIAVGLAKSMPDPTTGGPRFLQAYGATSSLSKNPENRLMASEILTALPKPLPEELPALSGLVHDVRKVGVPAESALGVASIVLFGQRADGSFATETVRRFLQETRSYESAALLGITNTPADALAEKFRAMRGMFASWGYEASEDTELASAYLAVSEYAPGEIDAKLAILARGLLAYLQYPLVAASILGSIATLEANETLNLVEKAYGIVGRQATGLSQTELICVAVRMVHGIRNELVGTLDATAAASAAPASRAVGYGPRPMFMFLPVVIVHGAYYSTFSGIGGVHPGHVHGMPSGFGGAGVG